jgi:hypothetical protein
MLECVTRRGGIDAFGELLAPVVVGDGEVDAAVSRVPKERHLDSVSLAVVKLSKTGRVHRGHPSAPSTALGA